MRKGKERQKNETSRNLIITMQAGELAVSTDREPARNVWLELNCFAIGETATLTETY